MKASTPDIEDADAIERGKAEFIVPGNRLFLVTDRDRECRARGRPSVGMCVVKNVFCSADTGRAFEDADEARLARSVLTEDDRDACCEVDLRAGLQAFTPSPTMTASRRTESKGLASGCLSSICGTSSKGSWASFFSDRNCFK